MSTALLLSATGPLLVHAVYVATGALAGFMAGLFGIGGGLVMVPALLACFSFVGVPADAVPALALGTSLTAIGFASALASRQHLLVGNLCQPFSRRTLLLAGCLCAGVVLGSLVATRLPRNGVLALIGAVQLAIAARMAWRIAPGPARDEAALPAPLPQQRLQGGAAPFMVLVGGVSSISGIGGATLMIPYFAAAGIDYRRAAALSTFFGCILGICGFVAYGLLARPAEPLPSSLGYVSLPAFASLAAGSLLLVRSGARLSTRLSSATLTRGFCCFLFLSGLKLLLDP